MELHKDQCVVNSSNSSTSEALILMERQLREYDIQLQHAVAYAEASQEKQTIIYLTIKDRNCKGY